MALRSRAKSLPASRAARDSPSLTNPNFPPQRARLSVPTIRSAFESLPPWDREVDVTFHKDLPAGENEHVPVARRVSEDTVKCALSLEQKGSREYKNMESLTYAAIVSALDYKERCRDPSDGVFVKAVAGLYLHHNRPATKNEFSSLLRLPQKVRRRIWHFVLGGSGRPPKPIRLQAFDPFLKAVWSSADFQSIKELLHPIRGALEVSFAMRADLLGYVLTSHRFHFTFSPYVKQKTCPELFCWIDEYSHLMQFLTIELDLSKLGFGASSSAVGLLPGNLHVNTAVWRWVDVQLARRTMSMQSLVLLARRYHGTRPISGMPYCHPAGDYAAAAPILRLSGKISALTVRIAGFNASTADHILAALFPDLAHKAKPELQRHCYRSGISTLWPFLPGQASVHRDAQYGKQPAPPKELARPTPRSRPTSSVSVARKQMTRLREMLAANEERGTPNSEASDSNIPTPASSGSSVAKSPFNSQLQSGNSFERDSLDLGEERKSFSQDCAKSPQSVRSERSKRRDSGLGLDRAAEWRRSLKNRPESKSFTDLIRRHSGINVGRQIRALGP